MHEPYHNKGFGVAYLWILFGVLVLPMIILFTSLGTWDMFWKMHLPDGDCWENAKHEKVCKATAFRIYYLLPFILRQILEPKELFGVRFAPGFLWEIACFFRKHFERMKAV